MSACQPVGDSPSPAAAHPSIIDYPTCPNYRVTVTNLPRFRPGFFPINEVGRTIDLLTNIGPKEGMKLANEIAAHAPYTLLDGVSEEKADYAIETLKKLGATAHKSLSTSRNALVAAPSAETIFLPDFWLGKVESKSLRNYRYVVQSPKFMTLVYLVFAIALRFS